MEILPVGDTGSAPGAATQPAAPAAAAVAPAPPAQPQQPAVPQHGAHEDRSLSKTVGDLLGGAGAASVKVSYRIEKPDEIVTVFSDAAGHEIAQVPNETMIEIAQFFDKHSGIAVDRNA